MNTARSGRSLRGRILPLGVAMLLVSSIACFLVTEPEGFLLPPPDMSLDPERIRIPRVIFACNQWSGGTPPPEEFLIVDIFPYDNSTREVRIIQAFGGRVLYRYNLGVAVRAQVRTSTIPELARALRGTTQFRRVEDLRRYDVSVTVMYRRPPYSFERMNTVMSSLGGIITHDLDAIDAVGAVVPDWSVRWLVSDPNVRHVEWGSGGCFGAESQSGDGQ